MKPHFIEGPRAGFYGSPCKRFEAYGWHVQSVPDGLDVERSTARLVQLSKTHARP
jgi:transketolase